MYRHVLKFGGSVLKSKADLEQLQDVVNAYNQPLLIVVSALYGVTDRLENHLKRFEGTGSGHQEIVLEIENIHLELLEELIRSDTEHGVTADKIKSLSSDLGRLLHGIDLLQCIPENIFDRILSFGERYAAVTVSAVLESMGIVCATAFPEEIGLITTGEFGYADVRFHDSRERIAQFFQDKSEIYIIPGFYGISARGEITLLGRGGSDYSAAAIGRCIGAETVDIWKDVPGFHSGDPKKLIRTQKNHRLTFAEAGELAYFGASILHPRTVEPLESINLPIRLFNIHSFSGTLVPDTVIESNIPEDSAQLIKSITYTHDIGLIRFGGSSVGIKPGVMAKITTILHESGINIKSVITSQTCINILLSSADLARCQDLFATEGVPVVESISYVNDLALVALVGEGITKNHGIAARAFDAVSRRGINLEVISAGASNVAVYFLVKQEECTNAVNAVHNAFFNIPREVNYAAN